MFSIPWPSYKKAYGGLSRETWWLSLVTLVNRSGTMVIPFLTVYLTSQLHFSVWQAGSLMAFFGAGSIAGALLGGWLTDKLGFHRVQFLSLFGSGVLFFVLGQMGSFWSFGICIFALSTIGESFRPANATAVAHYSDERNRTRSYSLNRLAINLGFSIGPALGGLLAAINFKLLFWADGATCIAASFLLEWLLAPKKKVEVETVAAPISTEIEAAWRDGIYVRFVLLNVLVSISFFSLFTIVPLYYAERIFLTESKIGLLMAMNGLLIVAVEMFLIAKLEGRRPVLFYIVLGALLIGLSFAVLAVAPVLSIAIISMIMVTFGEMVMFPFVNSFWVSRSKPENRGQYASLYTLSFSTAVVMSPLLGAAWVEKFGFRSYWLFLATICCVAAWGFARIAQKSKRNGSVSKTGGSALVGSGP